MTARALIPMPAMCCRFMPPLRRSVAFDGGTYAVTNQAPATWQFFQITVPADTNLLGWDVRLVGVTNGNPQMVVCRDTLPTGLSTRGRGGGWWVWSHDQLAQWQPVAGGGGLDGCGGGPMLEMGMGNPLQPGTYYIGVQDPNNTNSYTLQSRGIGLTNYTIAVQSLNFNGSVTNLALPVGEADYYQVVVPSNAPDWKLHLTRGGGRRAVESAAGLSARQRRLVVVGLAVWGGLSRTRRPVDEEARG